MDHVEFDTEFDVLYNNIMSNAAPGLNSYEKSVFLTKAQKELVKNYFNPKGNKYGEGFDDNLKREVDFSNIIRVAPALLINTPSSVLDKRSKVYQLPNDLFILLNGVLYTNSGTRQVIPISYAEYTRLMSKPFKEPLKYQAWRLITTSPDNTQVEIIANSNDIITEYIVRYLKRPSPIILSNIGEDYNLSIDGINVISECELNPIIHSEILQRAVELAKVAYEGSINDNIGIGQRTE